MSQFMQKGKKIHSVFSQSSAQPGEKNLFLVLYWVWASVTIIMKEYILTTNVEYCVGKNSKEMKTLDIWVGSQYCEVLKKENKMKIRGLDLRVGSPEPL